MDNKDNDKTVKNDLTEEISLPSIKDGYEETNSDLNNIFSTSMEEKDDKPKVQAQTQTLNPSADFSQIFNVASEEVKEEVPMTKSVDLESPKPQDDLAPEVKVDENVNLNKGTPKFNKDQFNNEEKVLYEIKPEKEGNPIVVFLFFTFLISFIVLLPVISKNSSKLFNFNNNENKGGDTTTTEDEFYELDVSSVRVVLDGLEFNNFVTAKKNDEYILTFTLSNTTKQPYLFDKKYYVVLYDDVENLVYRALMHSYKPVAALGAQEVNLILTESAYVKAKKFKIEEIPISFYPEVSLSTTEGEYQVLTCNYLKDEMKYYFANDKLAKIKETYKATRDETKNYEELKNSKKAESEKYNKIENLTSTFVETNTDFIMVTDFDLRNVQDKDLSDLETYRFFKYNETKNVISFELEAQGYTCG